MSSNEFVAKRGRPEAYPWSEWLSGDEQLIVRGVQFDAGMKLDTMIGMIRRKAKSLDPNAAITAAKVEDKAIRFRFIPPKTAPAKAKGRASR